MRGTAQTEDSDIDFLIEYSMDAKRSLFKRVELKHQLEDALGKKVDVVTVKALSPFIKDDVLKEKRDIL